MVHSNVFEVLLGLRDRLEMVDQLTRGPGPEVGQVNFEKLHCGVCAHGVAQFGVISEIGFLAKPCPCSDL